METIESKQVYQLGELQTKFLDKEIILSLEAIEAQKDIITFF